ncbi:hypothetical protein ACFYN0_26185 [Streptomyces sp. NPDC006704]|uniref:hypothetical protein n=1 Tax=Streptomyces sp. NPDC006704 TaxID=3364760 RepID=UPI0036D0E02F
MRFKAARPRALAAGPRALAALALLPALLAGCGIQSTGVIAVGDPASAQAMPPADDGTVLYFVGPDGLMPVVREGLAKPPLPLLFAGPNADERAVGLRTELPSLSGPFGMAVVEGGVTITLNQDVSGLSTLARRQIACTVLRAVARGAKLRVTLRGSGPGGPVGPLACEG